MNNLTPLKLAKVILRAAEIKEKSFDHIGYYQDSMVERRKSKREGNQRSMWFPDPMQYEKKDIMESCLDSLAEIGLLKEFAYPIYLSFHWWNDIIDWAEEQVKKGTWEWGFITQNDEWVNGEKRWIAWDETQGTEIGRYDTWVQAVFWLHRYNDTMLLGGK